MNFRTIILIAITSCLISGCKPKILILGWNEDIPASYKNKKAMVYRKDNVKLRNNFYGIWKGRKEGKELTMYFYKISDIPVGLKNLKIKRFVDAVYGYYTYKENDSILINSKEEAIKHNTSLFVQRCPFYGIPDNNKKIGLLFFIDYGIKIQNDDGSYGSKGAYANFEIDKAEMEKATFSIQERRNGVMVRTKKKGVVPEPYNYSFSLPTEWELVKVADEPPPLKE